jgi:acetyl esterase/lipase
LVGLGLAAGIALAPSWGNYHLPARTVRVVEDVPYLEDRSNPRQRLDLYIPTSGTAPFPVVVFVHGGFWKPMDRRFFQALSGLFGGVGVALANRGVVTAVVGYRQHGEAASIQDALDDVGHAVRFVVDHIREHGGDPGRVYLVGHSAGGMLTALLALNPSHLQRAGAGTGDLRGFVAMAGAYDLPHLMKGVDAELSEKVRASAGDAAGLERFSAVRQVRPDFPPLMLVVGSREPAVTMEEHHQLLDALKAAGGPVDAVEAPGEGHMDLVMHLSRPQDRVLGELLGFMEKHR